MPGPRLLAISRARIHQSTPHHWNWIWVCCREVLRILYRYRFSDDFTREIDAEVIAEPLPDHARWLLVVMSMPINVV